MKRVISLWLPRFATDRLLQRSSARPANPAARRPLATTLEVRGQLVLAGLDAAAGAGGLHWGLPLADARAILPDLETVTGDPPGDAEALERLSGWCGRYSPWTTPEIPAPDIIDGAGAIWLDVSGCAHLFGGEAALLADLTDRLGAAGYSARSGLADTPGAAWAAARYVDDTAGWTIVPACGTAAFLAPLPSAALRIAPDTVAALDTLGLRSVGALAEVPRANLVRRFGDAVAARLDAALGILAEPLSPNALAEPHFLRLGFAEPIGRQDDIAAALERLLTILGAGLGHRQRGARRLVLTLFEPNGVFHRFAIGTSRPSRDVGHLARLFAEPLADLQTAFGIESMTLCAPATDRQGPVQATLESGSAISGEDDAGVLIDRLANRLGATRVVRLAARESHIPERTVITQSALRTVPRQDAAWPANPRPLRLFTRPEPIDAVAPVPDDPPVMFRWRRVLHHVSRAEGPERITPEWWRAPEDDDAAGLRDYYRIEDAQGRRYWLYRQGLYRPDAAPAWFLHGLFG